jgi:hypothetical protein
VTSPTDDDRAADETLPAGGHTTVHAGGEAANPTRGESAVRDGDEPDEDFGDPALVRRFVSFPDLYRGGRSTRPSAKPHPVDRSAPPDDVRATKADPTDDVRAAKADPADENEPAAPATFRERFAAVPKAVPPISPRHQAASAGSRLSAVMVPVVIASGSILLATVAGIGGAMVTGSPGNGAASPSAATAPDGRSGTPDLSPKPGTGPSGPGPSLTSTSVTSTSGAGSRGVNPPTNGRVNVTPAHTPASRQMMTPAPPTDGWGPYGPPGWSPYGPPGWGPYGPPGSNPYGTGGWGW